MSHAARIADALDRREAEQPDMFRQALVADRLAKLKAEIRAAREARDLAEYKLRRAPHGTYKARFKDFSHATHALVMLEGQYMQQEREAAHG